jgi:predicted HicB family RNase H-like nuclease
MKAMTYKGYAARIEYDADDRVFVGHIAGIRDIIGFHGDSVDALERAFHEAVEDYQVACIKLGVKPQKPYSGRFVLRMSPEAHAAAAREAEISGKSLNTWAAEVIGKAVHA